jgi:predicted DNA-binding WGR domain protein
MVRNGFKECVGCPLRERDSWSSADRGVSTLVLHRVDAARNMARFYALSIEPTLFGGRSLVRNWDRIATRGRCKIELFEDEAAAETAMARLARIKSGCGYLRVPDPRRG